jgi:hypothetical protein
VSINIGDWILEKNSIGVPQYYQSKSGEFEFRAVPSKGRDVNFMERQFRSYLKKEDKSEEQIYRIKKIKIHKFWEWYKLLSMRYDKHGYPIEYRVDL